MEKFDLERQIKDLKYKNFILGNDIKHAEDKISQISEELFETKVKRIAMGEIVQTTKKRVLRHFGYDRTVQSYLEHDYTNNDDNSK